MPAKDLYINEPHPTVAPNTYTHSGRGGAGNTFRVSHTTPSVGVSTPAYHPSAKATAPRRFHSGVGGAGNIHSADERAVLNFDEDIIRARIRERSSVGHVGVGGAGNVYRRKDSDASSDSSGSRRDSEGAGFWGRLSGTFKRE